MNNITCSKNVISVLSYPFYRSKLSKTYRRIYSSSNYDECVIEIENAYRMMKKIALLFDKDYEMNFVYELLKKKLVLGEDLLEGTYITDAVPSFSYDNIEFENIKFGDISVASEKLDYIVWMTRRNIIDRFKNYYNYSDIELKDLNLVNECLTTSVYVELLCSKFNVPCKTIKIPPAYTDEIKLYDGDGYHYFNLLKLDGYYYIVDCTYSQFFTLDVNLLERMGVPLLNGCAPGVYMFMNSKREHVAKKILTSGWVLADEKNTKSYLDGFTLSYRNGLYYQSRGIVDYNVPYTIKDYENFFDGKDNQINHEGYNFLGVQEEPLEDYKLNFKIDIKK